MAVNAVATAFAKIVPTLDAGVLKTELGKAVSGAEATGSGVGKNMTSGLKKGLAGVAGVLGAAFSVRAIWNFTEDLIRAGEEEVQGNLRIEALVKNMDSFKGITSEVSKRITDYSGKLAIQNGLDDDSVKLAQAKLLAFSSVATTADEMGGVFDRATQAAIDLAASGFGSAEDNAVKLGKALEDPIQYTQALARSGVVFTDAEMEKIKALQESGDLLGAQSFLLDTIEGKYGGVAEASAPASAKLKAAWDEVTDAIGTGLLPTFQDVVAYIISDIIPAITTFIDEFKAGKTPLNEFLDAISGIFTWIKDNWNWLSIVAVGIIAIATAIGIANAIISITSTVLDIATIATWLFNAAWLANPITWIVIAIIAAIAAVIAIIWLLASNWDTIVKFISDVWNGFVSWITDVWNGFVNGFNAALGAIGSFFGAVFEGIGAAFKGYINFWIGLVEGFANFFIDAINGIIGTMNNIKFDVPDWVPLIGGSTFGFAIPKLGRISLPRLAEGGIVKPSPGGTIAQIAEAGKAEAVIPLDKLDSMLNGNGKATIINYNNYSPLGMTGQQQATDAIKRANMAVGW